MNELGAQSVAKKYCRRCARSIPHRRADGEREHRGMNSCSAKALWDLWDTMNRVGHCVIGTEQKPITPAPFVIDS